MAPSRPVNVERPSPGQSLASTVRLLSRWLVGDVVYAVLPVIVLTAITMFLSRPFNDFAEIKEWSFATIVFFGVTIRRFVRLKVEIQQHPDSYKLDTGIQLFVVGLVGSVLVLSLVTLKEMGIFANSEVRYLGHAQVALFATGLFSLLISVCAEDVGTRLGIRTASQALALARTNWQVKKAEEHMEAALEVLERMAWESSSPGNGRGDREVKQLLRLVTDTIERVGELGSMARAKILERPEASTELAHPSRQS